MWFWINVVRTNLYFEYIGFACGYDNGVCSYTGTIDNVNKFTGTQSHDGHGVPALIAGKYKSLRACIEHSRIGNEDRCRHSASAKCVADT
jgi:hypothetical protein